MSLDYSSYGPFAKFWALWVVGYVTAPNIWGHQMGSYLGNYPYTEFGDHVTGVDRPEYMMDYPSRLHYPA